MKKLSFSITFVVALMAFLPVQAWFWRSQSKPQLTPEEQQLKQSIKESRLSPQGEAYLAKYSNAGPQKQSLYTGDNRLNTDYTVKHLGTKRNLSYWWWGHAGLGVAALWFYPTALTGAVITGSVGLGTNTMGLHEVSLIPWTITAGLLVTPAYVAYRSYKKCGTINECLNRYRPLQPEEGEHFYLGLSKLTMGSSQSGHTPPTTFPSSIPTAHPIAPPSYAESVSRTPSAPSLNSLRQS